jgi:hypothetical protein
VRDIETIDAELRLVAALHRAARERGGPLPPIDAADALLNERRELTEWPTTCYGNFHDFRCNQPGRHTLPSTNQANATKPERHRNTEV